MPSEGEITELLQRLGQGERAAEAPLLAHVYEALKDIARKALHGADAIAINPTALVHELYLRNAEGLHLSANNRKEFFARAGHRMRQVLVDLARARQAEKRGAGVQAITLSSLLNEDGKSSELTGVDVLALDSALDALAQMDKRKAKVVELRYFAGVDMSEIAEHLGVTRMTVHRDWEVARSFLYRRLCA
jgi:RNA polymerase sigma factor (TIGR02999 family)